MRIRNAVGGTVAVLLLLVGMAGTAVAHPDHSSDGALADGGARDAHQHGATQGHLPASTANVEVVSKLRLKNVVPEKIADVGVHKGYAYLAAWGVETCKYNGVHVVDIRNPSAPREVAFIPSKEGSYPGEGVQALTIDTPAFSGDIVVTNNEKCRDAAGFGGMNIYDVTRPTAPTPLYEGFGDFTVNGTGKKDANETHSVFAWDAGDKAYAVMVDNEEGTDVDIVDISNPKRPQLLVEYDLDQRFPQILQAAPANLIEVFLHDMVVKEIAGRWVMLLSYWDAGYVKIDVTDPLNPVYLGDTDFADPDPQAAEAGLTVAPEGNAHQAEFTADNAYVIAADEDFDATTLRGRNVTDGTTINASQGSGTLKLPAGSTLTGVSVFAGRACNGDAAVRPGDATFVDVAVVERGLCTFTEKVANVIKAGGYDAVLVFNRTGTDACDNALSMDVQGAIPTFGVTPRSQGFAIFDVPYDNAQCMLGTGPSRLPVAVGATGDTLTFTAFYDGWGYVHLYRNTNGKLKELDTYAVPQAHDPAYAYDYGDLSVHEVATSAVDPALAYYSYYTAGFRVTKIVRNRLVEVGHFIDEGGSNFWGVEVFQHAGREYVAASDRDHGLYIFRYVGK